MIHIVFQHADVAALKKSFDLDESLRGDIIEIKDDFAVGPVSAEFSEADMVHRKQWWREVLAGGDYDGHVKGKHEHSSTGALLHRSCVRARLTSVLLAEPRNCGERLARAS